ncbi:MAG: hypothetical protein ACREFS_12020 [Acetobacteraceae bacterium]
MIGHHHAPRGPFGRTGAAAFLLLLAAAAPAHPPFAPTRDVRVAYRLESPDANAPGGQATNELILRAAAGGQKLRLDTPGSGAYLLIDPAAKSATMVDPKLRAFMTVPLNPKAAQALLSLDPGEAYRRLGNTMVAGLPCTIWAVGQNGDGDRGDEDQVSVTDDGVILNRIEGAPANRSRLTATAVTYATQPDALFVPPRQFQDLSLPIPPARSR